MLQSGRLIALLFEDAGLYVGLYVFLSNFSFVIFWTNLNLQLEVSPM